MYQKSVHESTVVAGFVRTGKRIAMGTNLRLFRHLCPSKSTTYHPPPHGRITSKFLSLMACLSCHSSVCCSSESCPSSDRALPYFDNYSASGFASHSRLLFGLESCAMNPETARRAADSQALLVWTSRLSTFLTNTLASSSLLCSKM